MAIKWKYIGNKASMMFHSPLSGVVGCHRVYVSDDGRFQIQCGAEYVGRDGQGRRRYQAWHALFDGEKLVERGYMRDVKGAAERLADH